MSLTELADYLENHQAEYMRAFQVGDVVISTIDPPKFFACMRKAEAKWDAREQKQHDDIMNDIHGS